MKKVVQLFEGNSVLAILRQKIGSLNKKVKTLIFEFSLEGFHQKVFCYN